MSKGTIFTFAIFFVGVEVARFSLSNVISSLPKSVSPTKSKITGIDSKIKKNQSFNPLGTMRIMYRWAFFIIESILVIGKKSMRAKSGQKNRATLSSCAANDWYHWSRTGITSGMHKRNITSLRSPYCVRSPMRPSVKILSYTLSAFSLCL